MMNPSAGIAGCSFENIDGSNWNIAFRFPSVIGCFEQSARIGVVSCLFYDKKIARQMTELEPTMVDWVSGACMMLRVKMIQSIGLLEETRLTYHDSFPYFAREYGWRSG